MFFRSLQAPPSSIGHQGLGPETDLSEARAQRLPSRAGEALAAGLVALRPCLGIPGMSTA